MAFQQGLSGLNAASKSLDVISNNVANSGNVGFKSGTTLFNDVYAAALNGAASGVQVGIGTAVGAVAQQFSQGNITPTNNPLDIAINGNGFFRVSGQGTIAYTRNGQFDVDKDGFVTSASGYRLTGYPADASGNILPASPIELQINTSDLQPQPSATVEVGLNLDSRETAPATSPFSATDPTSYNASTSVTLYDSLGNSHILTTYLVKTATGGVVPQQLVVEPGKPAAQCCQAFACLGRLRALCQRRFVDCGQQPLQQGARPGALHHGKGVRQHGFRRRRRVQQRQHEVGVNLRLVGEKGGAELFDRKCCTL